MTTFNILRRNRILVNTDPQRRCYNGCHFSSELRWTDWEVLESRIPKSDIDRRIQFWKELNEYAVSQRGDSAVAEHKSVEVSEANK